MWSKETEKILLNTIAECYRCHTLDFLKEIQRKTVEVELVFAKYQGNQEHYKPPNVAYVLEKLLKT